MIICCYLSLIITSCTKQYEKAPFQEEIYLEYSSTNKYKVGMERRERIKFERGRNGEWNCKTEIKMRYRNSETKDTVTSTVDENGKLKGVSLDPNKYVYGEYWIPPWLPPKAQDNTIKNWYTILGVRPVVQQKKYFKKWEVWPIEAKDSSQHIIGYYEVNTGWLVGEYHRISGLSESEKVLVNTNIDIPIVK